MSQQTLLVQGPDPVETADVHFKLCCKLKIFDSSTKQNGGHCNLIAVSQHYGLIFVGNLNGFTVLKTNSVNGKTSFNEYPRRDIILNAIPTHINVDFSQKLLAVISASTSGVTLNLYNVASFLSRDVLPVKSIPLAKNQSVVDLTWQPNADSNLMICMSDGLVLALNLLNPDAPVNTLPSTANATCFCWSPKGKQIVIGCGNGTLSQYKPDLKLVKTLPAPALYNGNVAVVGVLWISSFQFAVAYNDKSVDVSFPVIMIVNAAKNEPITFINYDDITFSATLFRNHQIYMNHQSAWNLIFVSSANSIEVALLHSKDSSSWEQWLLGDASRAELPLNSDHQETFPLGLAFDLTSEEAVTLGEKTLPPMPRILLLSDEGVLCVFTVVNAIDNAPQLCSPPKENVDDSLFSVPIPAQQPSGKVEQSPQSVITQAPPPAAVVPPPAAMVPAVATAPLPPAHSFGSPKPTFTLSPRNMGNEYGGIMSSQVTVFFPNKPAGDVKTQFFQVPQQQQQQQVDTQPIVISTQGGFMASSNFKCLPNTPQFGASNTSSSVVATSGFSFGLTNASTNLFRSNAVSAATLPGKPSVTITPVPQLNAPKTGSVSPVVSGAGAGAVSVSKSPSQVNLFRSMTPTKPVEPVGQPTSTPTKKGDEVPEPATKQEETKAKASGETAEPSPPELATVDDSVYWNALHEEIEHFNSELRQLSERMGSLDIQIGTEEDKAKLRKRLEHLHEFSKELKETTSSQSSEIHSVVTDLMESFAWLEDAKSRNLQRKNPSFVELKKSEELDPISARHMSDIAHLKYYIESQLKQLTSHLEKEWMDHQDTYRTDVKNRMAVPPLEEVYKTMHFQLKILSKQKALVEELKEKMAAKKRKDKTQMALITNANQILSNSNTENNRISELSKLADNLLQLKINKGEHLSDMKGWEAMRAQLKAIAERSKKLSSDKQAVLRDVLTERDMVKIRPVKTTFESSSFLRSVPLQKSVSKLERSKVVGMKNGEEESKQEKNISKTEKENLNLIAQPKGALEKKTEVEEEEGKKSIFVFGKPSSFTVAPPMFAVQEKEEKSPLASLSGIVSSIGKENEVPSKPVQSFMFGESAQTQAKPMNFFSLSPGQQQTKQGGSAQTFTFSIPKPDSSFGSKTTAGLFGAKLSFGVPENPPSSVGFGTLSPPKLEVSKSTPIPSVSVEVAATTTTTPSIPVTTNTTTTTTTSSMSGFSFSATTTTTATSLPKMGLSFEEQKPESGTGNVFSVASSVGQNTAAPIFGNSTPVFKTQTSKTGFEIQTSATFGVPKSSETVSKPLSFSFATPTTENKSPAASEVSVITSSKQENQEVDVVTVEETVGKAEEGKGSPKGTPTPTIVFGSAASVPKSVAEVTPTTTVAQTAVTTTVVQVASTVQSSPTVTTTSDSAKAVVATSVETPKTSAPGVQAGVTTTSSVFSPATSTTTLLFGQAAAAAATATGTTTTTTVATVFSQTPTTTASVFGQVSSTTPTTSIFGGGSILPTSTTSIFGGSPVSKPIFGQASAATTPTSGSIFGGTAATTPTTNTFGQVSTSPASTPSVFGTKPDAVAQTANIFGQLLSDSNRTGTVFGSPSTTSTPTTNSNIFKNIFGGPVSGSASTTTSSIFGTTSSSSPSSSIFPQTTSVFGQPTTTSASIFGQTPTSNSFFGQNICSPFGGGSGASSGATGTTSESAGGFGSKPVFGQSLFGQGTGNTTFFGGSQNTSSIFGSSTSSGGNVFQTPTTSTFGSTSPGPFSSGQGSVAETGFRAANSFQKPLGGFGSPPVFGGSPTAAPAFGASPTFSGSASFGSLPAFGSRPLFDSSQSGGTFGQSQGHSTTFENLANQNTVGFGNLAQQSQSQGFRVGGFGSAPAFENKAAFGGNSFSSWRSS